MTRVYLKLVRNTFLAFMRAVIGLDTRRRLKKALALRDQLARLRDPVGTAERERQAEQARMAEQERLAEQARTAAQEQSAEQARIAELERLVEQARTAEQARIAEQARLNALRREPAGSIRDRVLPIDGIASEMREFQLSDLRSAAGKEGWLLHQTGLPSAYHYHPDTAALVHGAPAAFPPKPVIAVATDAGVVGGTRFLIADDTTVVSDELAAFAADESVFIKYKNCSSLKNARISLTVSRRPGNMIASGLHAMHEYSNNYLHAVTEVLPRILLARERGTIDATPVLIDSDLHPNIRELIDLVDPHAKKIELEAGKVYWVRELTFPTDVSSIQDIYHRPRRPGECVLHTELIRRCAAGVLSAVGPGADIGTRRLYLRRGKRHRALLNEAEIEALLLASGFDIVTADRMTIREQCHLFQNAGLVVAPTGAALANIVWCKPGTRVVVLASDHEAMPTEVWTQLAEVAGCRVSFVRGPQAFTPTDQFALHWDYTIPPAAVADALTAL